MKNKIIKYSIAVGVGALIVGFVLFVNDFTLDTAIMSLSNRYRILGNAFSTSAALLLGVGALVFISSTGQFDGLSYVFSHLVKMMTPGNTKKEERFYDYKVKKMEKRKKHSCLFLILTGLAYAIVAVVFILLFHSV